MSEIKTKLNALKKRRLSDLTELNNLMFSVDKNFKFKAHETYAISKDNMFVHFRIGVKFFSEKANLYSFINRGVYYFTSRKEALCFRDNNSEEHLFKSLSAEISVLLPEITDSERAFRLESYLNKLNNLRK